MTSDVSEVHSCSYFCTNSACIKRQRDELRDRLPAQPAVLAVPGWRPIESVPSETFVLLILTSTFPLHPVLGRAWVGQKIGSCFSITENGSAYFIPEPWRYPTHWMPLPAAPAIHEGGEHA